MFSVLSTPASVPSRPIARPPWGAYPRSTRQGLGRSRPAGQTLYYHDAVCCIRKRRAGRRRLVVLPKLVFFPGDDLALTRPANHRASPRNIARLSDVQAPASCFTHSTARRCAATQTKESSATVTPLADLYSFHRAAAVHSARPVLYLQIVGDETVDAVGPREPKSTMENVTRGSRVSLYI